MSRFNIPEKYIHVSEVLTCGTTSYLEMTCDLIPEIVYRTSIFTKNFKTWKKDKLPEIVKRFTHNSSEYDLRKTFLGEDVNEEDFEDLVEKGVDFHRDCIVKSKGINPFRKNTKAYKEFGLIVSGITVKENRNNNVSYGVMRAAHKKNKLELKEK